MMMKACPSFYRAESALRLYLSVHLMSVFKVLRNQRYLIRNNIISIKALLFLSRVIVVKTSPVHRKRSRPAPRRDTQVLFVTVTRCNALKEAVPLKRNKAQHCRYLHAHILHPCYFTHDRVVVAERETHSLSLSALLACHNLLHTDAFV